MVFYLYSSYGRSYGLEDSFRGFLFKKMKNKFIYLLVLVASLIFISSKAQALDKVQISFSSDSINSTGYTNDQDLVIEAALDVEAEISENYFNCKNCIIKNFQQENSLEYLIFVRNLQEGEVEIIPDPTVFLGAMKYVYDKSAPRAVLNYYSKDEVKFQISEKLFHRVGDDLVGVGEGEDLKSFFSSNRPFIESAQYHDDGIGNQIITLSLEGLNRGDYLLSNSSAPLFDASGNKLIIEKLVNNGLGELKFANQIQKPTAEVKYQNESNKNSQTIQIKTEVGNEVFLYSDDQLVLSYEQSSAEQSFEIIQQNGQNNFRLFVRNAFLINSEFNFKILVDQAEPNTSYELSDREIVENDELKIWGETDRDVRNVELEIFDDLGNLTNTVTSETIDGKWSFEITELVPGLYSLRLKIQDKFLNTSVIDLGGIRVKTVQKLTKNQPVKLAMINTQIKSDVSMSISPKEEIPQESEIAGAKGLLASGTQDSQSSGILVNALIALLVIVFLSALCASVYFGYGYVLSSSRSVLEKVKVRKNEGMSKPIEEPKKDENQPDEKEPPSIRW